MQDESAPTHVAEDGESGRREIITLYKYMSLAGQRLEYAEDMLERNRIFLSRPDDFNDPFDCRFRLAFDATHEEKIAGFAGVLCRAESDLSEDEARKRAAQEIEARGPEGLESWEQNDARWEEVRRQTRSKVRISCLSQVRNSVAMWSHYADGHKGICVGFRAIPGSDHRRGVLCDSAGGGFAEGALRSPDALGVWKVRYERAFPEVNFYTMDHDKETWKIVFLRKSPEWSYEKEWRVADVHRPAEPKRMLLNGCISEVILGLRLSRLHRLGIIGLVKGSQPQTKLLEARMRPNEYALDIVPV